MRELKANLDLVSGGVTQTVHASQYDYGYSMRFSLFYEGIPFAPDNGVTATIEGIKADGRGFSYSLTIDGSEASGTLTEQMTAVGGRVTCEVVLWKNGERVATANFDLLVEPAPLDGAVMSETDIPVFRELAEQAAESAAEAKAAAEGVEEYATAAAASASAAYNSEMNALGSAATARLAAQQAATSASEASTDANTAQVAAAGAGESYTNAKASADAAAVSESNASASASAASTSATAAAASATAAATSEGNASASATAAEESASNAATSETNAAASATDAEATLQTLMSQLDDALMVRFAAVLTADADLDDYRETGIWRTGDSLPTNCPSGFTWSQLFITKVGTTWTQFLIDCKGSANGIRVAFRQGNSTSWGTWYTYTTAVLSETPTLASGWALYDSTPLICRKQGNVVYIAWKVKPTAEIAANNNTTMFTLPTGYRPATAHYVIGHGSGMSIYLCEITTGGAVKIQRYGTTANSAIGSGAWITGSTTFIVD